MSETAPKVDILLSAFNGEAYLRAQLDSLLGQNWPNLAVEIRDDGSADGTAALLREYAADPRVTVTEGENLGFIRSFFTLLKNSAPAEYYAFCDQDDVWLPDKLRRCVEALSAVDAQTPAMCFTGYELCDGELHILSRAAQPWNLSFANALVDCAPLGCAAVFNRAARDQIVAAVPEHSCGHDWWLYMVCAALGRVIPLPEPGLLYRRHGENASFGGRGFLRFQLWRFRKFFLGGYFGEITGQLREFESLYGPALTAEQRALLSLFTQKTPGNQWKKIVYPHRFRQTETDEIFLRFCFLLGRL